MAATMATYPPGLPVLVGCGGGATEISNEAYRMMRTVLQVERGVGDGAGESDPYVMCGQAAEILDVSAMTVARYLDTGVIPCEQ